MVPQPSSEASNGRSALLNAVIGGVVGVIISFVPLSPILGGGISGYLENGTREAGLKVGAGAGVVMLVPVILLAFVVMTVLGFGGVAAAFGGNVAVAPVAFGALALFVIGLSAIYTVGLSALGGYLGVYVREELHSK